VWWPVALLYKVQGSKIQDTIHSHAEEGPSSSLLKSFQLFQPLKKLKKVDLVSCACGVSPFRMTSISLSLSIQHEE
jgi:hypothetical protein